MRGCEPATSDLQACAKISHPLLMKMRCRAYVQDAYEDFKDCLLSQAASQLAMSGNVEQVQELLQHCPHILLPSLLDILSALPESMPVALYTHMLQVRGMSATSQLCLSVHRLLDLTVSASWHSH